MYTHDLVHMVLKLEMSGIVDTLLFLLNPKHFLKYQGSKTCGPDLILSSFLRDVAESHCDSYPH